MRRAHHAPAAHHIPKRPARATALVALAQDLPPAVLGPMPGVHPVTAAHWRRRASTDWTATSKPV
ncbi:hypothetical protein ACIBTP_41070 [Streptomyces avidinii]|uniref:hypothetical protein n=1 Tax=Streptomyces avidinii TaxID=1895 RepID=UPI0037BAA9FB